MMGGDDVSALVFDVGSSFTKVGHAGEDCPRASFPSLVGQSTDATKSERYLGESNVYRWRPDFELKKPLSNGIIEDWECLENIWEYAYKDRLRLESSEHPLLFTEPAWNTRDAREKLIEMAFEKFNVPAFYLGKAPALAAFAAGRPTALVVESGGDMTSVVPVHDGFVLKKGICKQQLAGNDVSAYAEATLKSLGVDIVPHYKVTRKTAVDAGSPSAAVLAECPNTHPSFHAAGVERVLSEFKETICNVAEHGYSEPHLASRPAKAFEFPDGYNNSFGIERFRIPEIMFNPTLLPTPRDEHPLGLTQLIQTSITNCDVELRHQLAGNIVVTGGNTLLPGLVDRLFIQLSQAPGKYKIHAAGSSSERKYGAWIGGSILASLGSFHQLWISKGEYEERGVGVEKRLQ
ncbi:Actin-like 6A [Chytridiales sp. JEL 0842]|nr:Actin-like 6A [Chytridiales sp. JEL 0842]